MMPTNTKNTYHEELRFIDLFAGLGGFHLALQRVGCECVFASEIKEDLVSLYRVNFPGTQIKGDITRIDVENIPAHDILCAGFPCQPFSQAGKRQGFKDEKNRGNLFYRIYDIIERHRPLYVILENVPTLKSHDGGNTWKTIKSMLDNYYEVRNAILSPHQFGIPHHRNRIYIVGKLKEEGGLGDFNFPAPLDKEPCDINAIIDKNDEDYIKLKRETRQQLDIWEEFIKLTKEHGQNIPRFPIWAMEFGANYRYDIAPAYQEVEELRGKRGHLGKIIEGKTLEECLICLPVYARTDKNKVFPRWKISYISQNRAFYDKNKEWIDPWMEKLHELENSHIKFEWNCGDNAAPTLWDKIIQFRASGIRAKLATFIPALNLVGTQIPIFPWIPLPPSTLRFDEPGYGRYMTLKEAAKVQGMEELCFDGISKGRIYEALGNAVNVNIVEMIARNLLNR